MGTPHLDQRTHIQALGMMGCGGKSCRRKERLVKLGRAKVQEVGKVNCHIFIHREYLIYVALKLLINSYSFANHKHSDKTIYENYFHRSTVIYKQEPIRLMKAWKINI